MEVVDEFPRDAGPCLIRPYEASDEGVVTMKRKWFITKIDHFLDDRKCKRRLALKGKQVVSRRTRTRKRLVEKIVEESTKLAIEDVENGKEVCT